jgi:predicted DNA-binding antitoxin AbrB/MazE fold protein
VKEVIFMLTVRGIYENGHIRLLEPVTIPEPCPVQVTFVQEAETEQELTPAQQSALAVIGLYNEMSAEQQQSFDEAMTWRLSFPQRETQE